MNEITAATILGVLTLIINYTNVQLVFPRRFNLRLSIILPVLYSSVFYAILLRTGTMTEILGGFRGFVHLPMIFLLIKGRFFQKIFCITLQMLSVFFLIGTARIAAILMVSKDSEVFFTLYIVLSFLALSVYVFLTHKFGKQLVSKLFINGHSLEWAIYSLGALFLLAIFGITSETVGSIPIYSLMMVLTVFSMIVLCFAIIRTHEITTQRYEAEFARSIITSGREHYQKMNEMYDTLRYLRHDYKYHLNTIRELLSSGNKDHMEKYLASVNKQLTEKELPCYCSNAVINALLSTYGERCTKLGIRYEVEVSLPETISIENYEMCIILGNLLENAVEACQKLGGPKAEHHRGIQLVVRPLGMQLALKVTNSFDGMILQDKGKPISTKDEGGLGLKSVQAVAARYDGELLMEWGENMFTAYVLLRL